MRPIELASRGICRESLQLLASGISCFLIRPDLPASAAHETAWWDSEKQFLQNPNPAAEKFVIIAVFPALPTPRLKSLRCNTKAPQTSELIYSRVNDAGTKYFERAKDYLGSD
jgi:hypothetical protein